MPLDQPRVSVAGSRGCSGWTDKQLAVAPAAVSLPPTHVRPSPPLVRCGGGLVPQEQLTGIMFQDVGGGSGLDFCLAEVEIV